MKVAAALTRAAEAEMNAQALAAAAKSSYPIVTSMVIQWVRMRVLRSFDGRADLGRVGAMSPLHRHHSITTQAEGDEMSA